MKRIFEYLKPMLITCVLFIVVYMILNITPFGSKTVFHYDMGLQYYPALTLMWDVLHGERGLFYNFNIGGGESAYASLVSNGFFSPVNWLVALGERESIPTTTSWVLMIKFALISLSTYYVLKKMFPNLKEKWILLGSLLNTFSSYSLLYYINFQWIECWALFPLIMLGIKNILDGKSGVLFTISLTACLLISFYMSWLILLIIIFGGFLALILYCKKENRIKAAGKIFFNTFISLFISFISFYPAFTVSMSSYRMENTNVFLEESNPIIFKSIHFLTCPILLYYNFKMLSNYKNDSKNVKLLGGLLLITTIPFFIEPINKMWHTGSYSGLPFRFGFIIIFIMICSMLHYIDVRKDVEKKHESGKVKLVKGIILFILIINIIFNIYSINQSGDYQYIIGEITQETVSNYINIAISVIIGINILGCTNILNDKKFEYKIIFALFIVNALFLMFLYIKNLDIFSLENKVENESLFIVQDYYENFYEEDIYKVKDETQMLFNNYPYVLKANSIENWFHIIPERQVNAQKKLGYSYYRVVQEDNGGTLISDLVLGVNKIFSNTEKNGKVYKLIKEADGVNYYTYNFKTLPLCKIYEFSEIVQNFLEEDFEIKNVFETQNDLYKVFFNDNDDIIKLVNNDMENIKYEAGKYIANKDSKIKYNINVNETSNLYIYMYNAENCILKIKVFDEQNNKVFENYLRYPSYCYNGILDLGVVEKGNYNIEAVFVFEDEEIELGNFEKVELGILDVNKLITNINEKYNYDEKVEFGKNDFKVEIKSSEENQKLFIPINYDEGWTATLNGKEIPIDKALGTYMSINLEKGDNEINFSYFPSNLKMSINITFAALALYIILNVFCKITKIENSILAKIIFIIGTIMFFALFIIFTVVIYIKPII